jgi:prolyl-tRNA editing enzyme YbaK/EbsC (Cys-tRNA(Pro) deacylase)
VTAFDVILAQLGGHAIEHRILEHAPAGTVEEAVAAGFDVSTMLKTVVFRAKAEPLRYFLCALKAQDAVDYKKLASATHIKRDELVRPLPEEVQSMLGFEAGAVGPFAVTETTQVFFDQTAVQSLDWVHCGCGRRDRTLEARVADLIQLSAGKVVPLAR